MEMIEVAMRGAVVAKTRVVMVVARKGMTLLAAVGTQNQSLSLPAATSGEVQWKGLTGL